MSKSNDLREKLRVRLIDALVRFSEDETLREIDDDSTLTDCGLDSLGHFNFLLSLEGEFDFEIPDHQLTFQKMGSLAGILDVLCDNLGNREEG